MSGRLYKDFGAELQRLIAEMGQREWPTEDAIAKREAFAQKSRLETNKIIHAESFLNHLPDRLRGRALNRPDEDLKNRRALELAAMLQPGDNLFLYGRRGVGKTHMAAWAALNMIRAHGVTARFLTWAGLLDEFDAARRLDHDRGPSLRTELLVVDDIDKSRTTTYASERVFQLLGRLEHSTMTTIITSNHDPLKTAKLFYGEDWRNQEAIASRLMAMQPVLVEGVDRRVPSGAV